MSAWTTQEGLSTLAAVMEAAAAWYRERLRSGQDRAAAEYAARRGLDAGTLERYQIGAAPDGWHELVAAAHGGRLPLPESHRKMAPERLLEALVALGLVRAREDGSGHYDLLRGRLVLPIHDEAGRAVALTGRALGSGEPKYLNTPDSPLWSKRTGLFGFGVPAAAAQWWDALKAKGEILLVEGYLDAIAARERLGACALAVLGTALTPDQADLLEATGARVLTLALDADDAGRLATRRALVTLAGRGAVRVQLSGARGAKDLGEALHKPGEVRLSEPVCAWAATVERWRGEWTLALAESRWNSVGAAQRAELAELAAGGMRAWTPAGACVSGFAEMHGLDPLVVWADIRRAVEPELIARGEAWGEPPSPAPTPTSPTSATSPTVVTAHPGPPAPPQNAKPQGESAPEMPKVNAAALSVWREVIGGTRGVRGMGEPKLVEWLARRGLDCGGGPGALLGQARGAYPICLRYGEAVPVSRQKDDAGRSVPKRVPAMVGLLVRRDAQNLYAGRQSEFRGVITIQTGGGDAGKVRVLGCAGADAGGVRGGMLELRVPPRVSGDVKTGTAAEGVSAVIIADGVLDGLAILQALGAAGNGAAEWTARAVVAVWVDRHKGGGLHTVRLPAEWLRAERAGEGVPVVLVSPAGESDGLLDEACADLEKRHAGLVARVRRCAPGGAGSDRTALDVLASRHEQDQGAAALFSRLAAALGLASAPAGARRDGASGGRGGEATAGRAEIRVGGAEGAGAGGDGGGNWPPAYAGGPGFPGYSGDDAEVPKDTLVCARRYLCECGLVKGTRYFGVRYWMAKWWVFDGTQYRQIQAQDVEDRVWVWLSNKLRREPRQRRGDRVVSFSPTPEFVKQVVRAMAVDVTVRGVDSMPAVLEPDCDERGVPMWGRAANLITAPTGRGGGKAVDWRSGYLVWQNGVLDEGRLAEIEPAEAGRGGVSASSGSLGKAWRPHDPSLFHASTMPYPLDIEQLPALLGMDHVGVDHWLLKHAPATQRYLDSASRSHDGAGCDRAWEAQLQEMLGDLMSTDRSAEFIGALAGVSRGGKGVAEDWGMALLGEANVVPISVSMLEDKFGLAALIGKRAAIMSEMHLGRQTNVAAVLDTLKTISGKAGRQLAIRDMHTQWAQGRVQARVWLTMNNLPTVLRDQSGAFAKRLCLLPFRRSFAKKPDPAVKAGVVAEAPATAVWALAGLWRLRLQTERRPAMCEWGQRYVRRLERATGIVKAFMDDMLVTDDAAAYCSWQELYRAFIPYAKDRGQEPMGMDRLISDIEMLLPADHADEAIAHAKASTADGDIEEHVYAYGLRLRADAASGYLSGGRD